MNNKYLRIVTYNVHKGFNVGNRHFVLHQIREALRNTDADLLFLQEMQGKHTRREIMVRNWPEQPQPEFLAEDIWPYYAYGKNAIYDAGHHGNAILSKFPFEKWENINVSPFSWASRSLLHGVIRISNSNQPIHVICIHFGLLGNERRLQIEKLCNRIDNHVPHAAPLIIAGDFNDWFGQADTLLHTHLGLNEVFRSSNGHYARSFPSWLPFLQMDRIYYRGLLPVSCERLQHNPWYKLSDHAPLMATFTL